MEGMGGNRVEELESKVNELQATIDGLTDELLECKERIETLEREVDPDMDIIEGGITGSPSSTDGAVEEREAETDDSADRDNIDGDEAGDDSDANDIIVA
jgi:chromosome segregation ATPase